MTTGSTDYRSNPTQSGSSGVGGSAGAGGGVGGVKDAAKHSYEAARQEAAGLGEELRHQGSELVGAARARAQGLAEEQKAFGADQIDGIARAATKAADELEQASPQLARYVRDAASAADNFSSSLRDRSVGDLLQSVTNFARREPVMFFGLTVAAGFALSRFLRSSASHADQGAYRVAGSDYRSPYGGSPGSDSMYRGSSYEGRSHAGHDADFGQPHTPVAATHATPAEFPTGKTTTTDPMRSGSAHQTGGTGGSTGSSGIGTVGSGIGTGGASSSTLPGGSASSPGSATSPSMTDNKPSSGTTAIGASASPTRTTFPSGTSSSGTSGGTGSATTPKSSGGPKA